MNNLYFFFCFRMMQVFLIPVATVFMMSSTNGLPPLKALGFLTQKLLPLSKNHAGTGKYLQDSFRVEHLIPSFSRIKNFLFTIDTQFFTLKIGITIAFVVTAIGLFMSFALYYNLKSKISKLKK